MGHLSVGFKIDHKAGSDDSNVAADSEDVLHSDEDSVDTSVDLNMLESYAVVNERRDGKIIWMISQS